MKLTITVAAAVAASMFALADADAFYTNPTNAEQCIANALAIASGSITNRNVVRNTLYPAKGALDASAIAQMDQILCEAKDASVLLLDRKGCKRYPKAGRAFAEAIKADFPAYYKSLDCLLRGVPLSATDWAAAYVDSFIVFQHIGESHMSNLSEAVLKAAPRAIRVKLRNEGKAITEKDGVDPVNDIMGRITAALNAPRFAGLKDALAEAGIDIRQPEVSWIPAADSNEGRALMDAVFYGDVMLNNDTRGKLRYMLGTDGYNAFVERYNGGTR